jgi:hemerythrin-like metal-binding protein
MLLMWTGNLKVGVKAFDDDHKRLVRLANELHGVVEDAGVDGKIPVEEIEIALHRLQNYLRFHCDKEEAEMARTRYPELAEHKAEHAKLAAKIAEMSVRFRGSTDPRQATELMQMIHDWLIDHIHGIDRKYTAHLNAKGIF